MQKESGYIEYARAALEDFDRFDNARRNMLVNAVRDEEVASVLDVGCGPGHQLLAFAEAKGSFCVGLDIGEELGEISRTVLQRSGTGSRIVFLRAAGEELPFQNASFDVVICRLALPYMDDRTAIAEMARVLKVGGKMFLKTHAPGFYLWMLKKRLPTLSLKQLAYPVICFACGTINLVAGKRPQGALWKGKEVYQSRWSLRKELARNHLRLIGELDDTNFATPSFVIEKGSPA